MSTTIDNRVLEMRFDNKQFENGVATSMSTLDKLKAKLNLSGASKGLENIGRTTKNVNMSGLGSAVEAVSAKFSALQVMGVTALANITNSAVNTGKKIASALTIDPIKTGFQEYETQIGAIQTILSNTRQEGTNVEIVNRALDELNTYADKTIYNFTEMTRNIGTFTAAGVKLDTSVNAIKGIANLAAVSGSTSQQASAAMYQLSQALAAGKVSLMDWNSVVTNGMGGKVFQDALVRTSELLGTGAKGAIEMYGSFRESLTKGEWLTTEVLTETLNQLSGVYDKADLMAQGYTESQADEIMALAKDAEDAATKVKTFTQLIDTVKESLQSGWSQTWRILVGDFEESKELFTDISDAVGRMIESSANSRNELLTGAMTSNWDKLVSKINEAGIETDNFEEKIKSVAEDNGYNTNEIIQKYGSLEKVFQSGAVSSNILKEAVNGLKTELINLSDVEVGLSKGSTGKDVTSIQSVLQNLNYDIGDSGADGIFGSATEAAVKAFQEVNNLKVTGIVDDATLEAINEANNSTHKLIGNVDNLIEGITELGGREKIITGLKNVFEFLGDVIKPVREAFGEIFPPVTIDRLTGMIDAFKDVTETLKISENTASKIKSTFKGVFSVIDIGVEAFKALGKGAVGIVGNLTGLGGNILDMTSSFGDFISNIRDSIIEGDLFGKSVDKIGDFLNKGISKIMKYGNSIENSFKVSPTLQGFMGFFCELWNVVKSVGSVIGTAFGDIGNAIADVFGNGDIFEVLNGGLFASILLYIRKFVKSLSKSTKDISLLDSVKKTLDGVHGCLEAWQSNLKSETLLKIAGAIGILATSLFIISGIDENKLGSSLAAIGGLFVELISALTVLEKINSNSLKPLSGIVASLSGIARTVQMIGLGAAVLILTSAMKNLSHLDWNGVAKGLVGIGGIVTILVTAAKLMNTESKSITKFAGQMLIMSVAIAALSEVAKNLSSMSWNELAKGGAGILGIVAILVGAARLMNTESKSITKFAGQMLIMSAAVGILSAVGKSLGSMSWNELAKGGAGILGVVTMFVLASKVMSKGSGSIVKFGGQMLLMASALAILTPVLKSLGSMNWESIGKGLAVIGIALVELSVGLRAMNGSIKGSAALVVAAAGLAILAPVLKSLGSMSWGSIAKGLVTLAGSFAVIGIAGSLLSPLAPAILALSAAMGVFALSIAGLGIGIFALSTGFTMLATAGTAGATAFVAALTVIITGILGLIPEITEVIGRGIVEIAKVIGDYAPQLAESFLKLLLGVLNALEQYAPQIVDSLLVFTIGVINSLADHTPELISAVIDFVSQVANGVVDAIGNLDMDTMLKGIGAFGAIGLLMHIFAGAGALAGPAMIGVLAVGAVIAEIAVLLAAIGKLSEYLPEGGIEKAGDLLESIGNSLGRGIGSFIGGIGEGITGSLQPMAEDITSMMEELSKASDKASGIKGESFDGVKKLLETLGSIGLTTVGTSISDVFTLGGTSMEKFQEDGVAFFDAMKSIGEAASGTKINSETFNAVIGAAEKLSGLQSSLSKMDGVISWFTGDRDLSTFGTKISSFMTSMKDAMNEANGISVGENFVSIISAAQQLSSLQSSLDQMDGVIKWFTGDRDLGTFGTKISSFMSSMGTAMTTANGISVGENFGSVISAVQQLSSLQSSLDQMDGVISWFTGDRDLSTFGTKISSFMTSMSTAMNAANGITVGENFGSVISAAQQLSSLQSSLEQMDGVIKWFTGDRDLGTFGTKISSFMSSMGTAMTTANGISVGENFVSIISAVQQLSSLQSSLDQMDGVISWFTGDRDLGTFGTKISSFMSSMGTAMNAANGITVGENFGSIISAAQQLSALESSLEPIGTVIDWFNGKDDLGDFGERIYKFAEAIGKLKTGMGEDGISTDVVNSVTNAGSALIALQEALPETGWFDGKLDLDTFSEYVNKFAEAMSEFSNTATNMKPEAVDVAITAANRIKNLVNALADLETDGVATFAGIGAGDGALVNIGQAIGKFGESVGEMDTAKVTAAVDSAISLKNLISSLSGLETEGIENFKVGIIGAEMKSYSESLTNFDPSIVSSSISSARNLASFISGLTGLDSSGVINFKIAQIGLSLQIYSNAVAGFNTGAVMSSITAGDRLASFVNGLAGINSSGVVNFKVIPLGNAISGYSSAVASVDYGAVTTSISAALQIKSFINGLSGFNASGVDAFKSAVSSLAQTNIGGLTSAFSGSASQLSGIGSNLVKSLTSGFSSGSGGLASAADSAVSSLVNGINGKAGAFLTAGTNVMSNFVKGIASQTGPAQSTAVTVATTAATSTAGYYGTFYSMGSYVASGFVTGIAANISAAANAAASMAAAASAAARANLRIHSPSRVFMKIGSYVPQGFAKGIKMYGSTVKRAAGIMTDSAVDSTQKAILKISDAFNNDIDTQPTIRPVLDLSDIKSGAAVVDGLFSNGQSIGVMANLNAISSSMSNRGQNGSSDDIVYAINKLSKKLDNVGGNSYNINGVTYDDGSNITSAVETLIRAAKIERRS